MREFDRSDLPDAADDGGAYDLRWWQLDYDSSTADFLLNLESDAAAFNGLVRPTVHARGCHTLVGDTDGWPIIDKRTLIQLWSEEREAQPMRRVWFCERCTMKSSQR